MFTWDVNKAISNFEKHGISFEEAATVFSDPDGLHLEAKHVGKELRFFRIGESSEGKVLIVVFTVRKLGRDKETFLGLYMVDLSAFFLQELQGNNQANQISY